jgi:SAM-dependent methyltransferase
MSIQGVMDPDPPGPEPLMDLLFGNVDTPMVRLPILRAGVELQVWERIAAGHQTAKDLAAIASCDMGGLRRLLDALVVMKLLEKAGDKYDLPAWAHHYLIPGRPAYLGTFVLDWLAWEGHGQLSEAIRRGTRPIRADCTREEMISHFLPFYAVRALAPARYLDRHDACWQTLQIRPREGLRVLDVACGAGIASLALARLHPGVRVFLQDWPPMLELAMQVAAKLGIQQQVTQLPGDMALVQYEESSFDVVRLGYVTYLYDSEYLVQLFTKLRECLADGGVLVIEAPLADEGRREREDAVLDGPWLFAISPGGDVYSYSDYARMLGAAGFARVEQAGEELLKATCS